ncbi:hypothetical protein Tco_0062802 [Tanacetum coccineum]
MANQELAPPQQEMAENPVPFTHAKHVGFNLEDFILNTNNEVALLYPEHSNKEVFLCVSDFISKCCIKKAFTRSPIQYKEYLSEFWYSTKALDNYKVDLPSIDIVRPWFSTIGYGEEVSSKGTLKKILLPPMWRLLMV